MIRKFYLASSRCLSAAALIVALVAPLSADDTNVALRLDFSGYSGGSVDDWLRSRNFVLERDAKNRRLLQLSVENNALVLQAKGRLIGLILNDSIEPKDAGHIRINWGILKYPVDVSYHRKINNEALMLYVFFGKEKVSSGHLLIPNSPYFIGLFLGQDEQIGFPYKGRYFHASGRFVCLGNPAPAESITSEFDLDTAFKKFFGKHTTPSISGIAFGVDTSQAGGGGTAGAFIKSIEFMRGQKQ